MGLFEEQIKQRKISDQEIFGDSFVKVAGVVLGERAAGMVHVSHLDSKRAIDDILKYYRHKPATIPDAIGSFDGQLEYALRPHGIMRRNITLSGRWYRDSFGPILGFDKETEVPVALLPRAISGYYFIDRTTGRKVGVNAKTAERFKTEALCFYRPLPSRKLTFKDLLLYLKGCIAPGNITLMALATLAVTLIGLIAPKLSKVLTGPVLESGDYRMLIGIAVFLVAAAISKLLIGVFKDLVLSRLSTKTSVAVEAAVMMRLMTLPAPFFRKYGSGNLSKRASAVSGLCTVFLSTILSSGLTALMSVIYLSQIADFAPALVVPSVAIILLTVTITAVTSVMQVRIARKQMDAEARESGLSYAFVTGVQKIKLSGAEKRAYAKWSDVYSEGASYRYNPPLLLKTGNALTTAISLLGTILLFYVAAKSGLGVSDYFAFNVSYGLVMGAFSSLSTVAIGMAGLQPIFELADPILNEEPETTEERTVVTGISGAIELNRVFFRYEEDMPYVINDLSIKINPGENVAVDGKTGCGKSTLMRLLLGFEQPERGDIYYDGKDLRKLDLKSLRSRIGVVMQNSGLLTGSIYENITVSAPGLSLDDAWKAAELAGIADDIRRMPMGMMTLVSEGQGGFSGGQKQRLMIARALAHKPRILLFDEATSALDNKTQKQVSDALDGLKCTRIVIAHRLSTIKNCNRIIVLEGGKIIEDGTYAELLAADGFFADLVRRQRPDAD